MKRINVETKLRAGCLFALCLLLSVVWVVQSKTEYVSNTVGSRKLPIYCVETKEKQIALSFDAAWGNEDTKTLLDILKRNGVKVTFFMTGGWVESFPEDVKAIAKEGHELGNHSENHKQMSTLSAQEDKEELMSVHEKVKKLTGVEMKVFRPPYGDYDNTLVETANACGYQVIQWDVDSLDWKDYGKDAIIHTVVDHKHLGSGSIILCHNGAKYTKEALEPMIRALKEKGYEFVKMSDLIYRDHYTINTEGRQIPNENNKEK
ncbi:MAG: polysaccharide deacetylase family protein [Lachnospiraceae bacterium]|nr:polysaccharide deacetylase family protein [Lachnospiraceae bacterium]